ncbi:MAG TPA: nucleoid-associated protein [Thermoanaerobaculia bacterium]|nr:nucleoid-associated protein [Thermoanaerobaculia bacterium]
MHIVDQAIIHKLVKEKQGKSTVAARDTALALTTPVTKLVSDIHELYAERPSKGHGRFEADEVNFPAATILRKAFKDSSLAFVEASQQLLSVLKARADQAPLATGGYVLMAQVSDPGMATWFIAAIINNVAGNAIKDETLEVIDTVHVDLENLRVAGRVNLSEWFSGNELVRYVGFLKQRGEVSEYFKLFLGCNELIASKEESRKLVEVLKDFAGVNNLEQQVREEFLNTAYSFCQEHSKANRPLSLEALSNAVWPGAPKALQTALATANVQLSDGFVPDIGAIRLLVKIKAKTKFWSVDLDRRALVAGHARYNRTKGELVLLQLPDGLKAELDHELSDGN